LGLTRMMFIPFSFMMRQSMIDIHYAQMGSKLAS